MTTIATKQDKLFYINELKSNECQCGRDKKPDYAFCFTCYDSLPWEMRKALWRRVGNGYEEAYEEAFLWLNT